MKYFFAWMLAAAILLSLTGCGKENDDSFQMEFGSNVQYATEDPEDLTAVLDRLYETITVKELQDIDRDELFSLLLLDPEEDEWLIEDFAMRVSSGRYGVADAAIIQVPLEEDAPAVVSALENYRDGRIAQFENYDIFDSLEIARDAEIFARGRYVILLMLENSDEAQRIILEEIPG